MFLNVQNSVIISLTSIFTSGSECIELIHWYNPGTGPSDYYISELFCPNMSLNHPMNFLIWQNYSFQSLRRLGASNFDNSALTIILKYFCSRTVEISEGTQNGVVSNGGNYNVSTWNMTFTPFWLCIQSGESYLRNQDIFIEWWVINCTLSKTDIICFNLRGSTSRNYLICSTKALKHLELVGVVGMVQHHLKAPVTEKKLKIFQSSRMQ